MRAIEERRPSLVILDIWLQGSKLDGLELLDRIKRAHPDLPVVIISGHGNIETAVAAIKRGAYDYIEKPFKADRLVLITARALEASKLRRENRELRERSAYSFEMIGRSAAINQLRQAIEKVAPTNSRVLITGPSGCGKELAARVMHMKSARADGPFVVLNAAAMVPDRVELELFGTEEGAAQARARSARSRKRIRARSISTRSPTCRSRRRARSCACSSSRASSGSAAAPKVHVDVRVISSTSRDLQKEMSSGRLREDLFHRLNVVPIRVPGLSERREDIPELVRYFVQAISVASGLPPRRIGEDAMAVLQSHDWPGNVRQLRNNIERLMILVGGDADSIITADMLPEEIISPVPLSPNGAGGEHLMSLPLRDAREIFEREYLLAQVNRFGGNISRTAEFVGMERSALHRKLRALGVNSNERGAALR